MKDHVVRSFVRQQDQSDCGVACLASIVKYYGGEISIEDLRKTAGTSRSGTSLLGLLQAAEQAGFEASGLLADSVASLKELAGPAILHVDIENGLQHYVVFYPDCSSYRTRSVHLAKREIR